nr:MAG TPA: hypothetical protein [Caudoviricetes sp.]
MIAFPSFMLCNYIFILLKIHCFVLFISIWQSI